MVALSLEQNEHSCTVCWYVHCARTLINCRDTPHDRAPLRKHSHSATTAKQTTTSSRVWVRDCNAFRISFDTSVSRPFSSQPARPKHIDNNNSKTASVLHVHIMRTNKQTNTRTLARSHVPTCICVWVYFIYGITVFVCCRLCGWVELACSECMSRRFAQVSYRASSSRAAGRPKCKAYFKEHEQRSSKHEYRSNWLSVVVKKEEDEVCWIKILHVPLKSTRNKTGAQESSWAVDNVVGILRDAVLYHNVALALCCCCMFCVYK